MFKAFERRKLTRYLPTLVFVIVVAGLVGAFYGFIMTQIAGFGLEWIFLVWGAERGIFVALVVLTLETWVQRGPVQRRLRSMAFVPAFILRSLITAGHLIFALALSHMIYSPEWLAFSTWVQRGLFRDFIFAAGTAFVVQLILQARRLVGGTTLRYFLMGRYSRPVNENRIFLLADMAGSTSIADKIGDQRSLELITGYFLDLDPVIHEHGGMIHNYVGDEIVISWPDLTPSGNTRVVECVRDIFVKTAEIRQRYLDQFGVAPQLRIGVAAGSVAVGECGWEKRQVIYIGDTINTAKRLQETSKTLDVAALTDTATLERIVLPKDTQVFEMGRTTLRGREAETNLIALGLSNGPFSLV